MPTLPNMSLITPTLGGDSGTWDDKINAALGLVDAHDHTSGKGVAIVSAALNINADVVPAPPDPAHTIIVDGIVIAVPIAPATAPPATPF